MSASEDQLTILKSELTAYTDNLSQHMFILMCSFAIVFMQAGFAMLEAGACRSKNSKSILYKNGIDLAIGVLIWWFWGFGFSTANNDNNAIREFDGDLALSFLITVAFCTTSATIVSGAVAERINFWVYIMSTISIAGGSYPLVAQWMWTSRNPDVAGSGWFLDRGVVDFAGSGVVHLVGATAAITAAWWVGPRVGRFIKNADGTTTSHKLQASDPILCTIGTWVLIFGWLSFNASSSGAYGSEALHISTRAVVMTIIAMAAGGLSCTLVQGGKRKLDLNTLNNGLLGALVAITAPCASVDAVGAFFIGFIGGIISMFGNKIPAYLKIDDPLDTFTVHGLNGAWGLISVGFFGTRKFMNPDFDYGCFYGGTGRALGYQIAAVLVISLVAWGVAFATMGLLYLFGKYVLQMPDNPLRISFDEEVVGLDIKEFGGYAYPEHVHQEELIMQKAVEMGVDISTVREKKATKARTKAAIEDQNQNDVVSATPPLSDKV